MSLGLFIFLFEISISTSSFFFKKYILPSVVATIYLWNSLFRFEKTSWSLEKCFEVLLSIIYSL